MPKPLSIEEFVAAKSAVPVTSETNNTATQPLSIEEFVSKKSAIPAKRPDKKLTIDAFKYASPLQNIARGDGKSNIEVAKGAAKGALETLYGASAFNAGPIGRAMLDSAPALKEQVEKYVKPAMTPTNEAQQFGKASESVAEMVLPGVPATKLAKPVLNAGIDSLAVARQKKVTDAVGRVLQGDAKDIETGRKVLSNVDIKGVKSYEDLAKRLDEQVGAISSKYDEALEAKGGTRTLENLDFKTTVGGQTVRQNYVQDALDQLETYYVKTNNITEATKIRQLREKAITSGLNPKEINDIARLHGRDLNAFNASGELASGLSKKAAENTRSGVKATVRDLFADNLGKAADSELTKLIRVRDLAKDMSEKVTDLQQKIMARGLGGRVARLVVEAADILSGGFVKGLGRSLLVPRGQGYNVLNALDLEKQLAKNLKLIQKAGSPDASEQTIIQALEQFIKNNTGKLPLLLPEKTKTGLKLPSAPIQLGRGADTSGVRMVPAETAFSPKFTLPMGKPKGSPENPFIMPPAELGTKLPPNLRKPY